LDLEGIMSKGSDTKLQHRNIGTDLGGGDTRLTIAAKR